MKITNYLGFENPILINMDYFGQNYFFYFIRSQEIP